MGPLATTAEQSPVAEQDAPPPGAPQAQPPSQTCPGCGAGMIAGSDWCLSCGAAGNGGRAFGSSWRPLGTIAIIAIVLLAGAGAAAYAALSRSTPKRALTAPRQVVTVTPATVVPTTPPATPPLTPPVAPRPPTAIKPLVPSKLPPVPATPKTPVPVTPPAKAPGQSHTPLANTPGATKAKPQLNPILLDTNAASTYDPSGYPAAYFGDPSLAIDDDPATAWTAQVDPAVAPRMAEGLVIDLKERQKVSALDLQTSSIGMTVEIYATSAKTLPKLITDRAWAHLGGPRVLHKQKVHIKLRKPQQIHYVAVWITKAPAAAVGTVAAPGHVDVRELSLFSDAA
jgi:hypothetical protein